MDGVKLTVSEFKTRVFNESIPRIRKCVELIDEQDLWRSPNEKIASIGCNIQHVVGNARQWILSSLLGQKDERERSKEFIANSEMSKDELDALLVSLKNDLTKELGLIDELTLNHQFEIQGFSVSGFSAMIHVIEHFSYHTGQITLLTKLYTGVSTDYYDESNLDVRN